MKVAVIHGQNHKGSTYNIGRMIADKITYYIIDAARRRVQRHLSIPIKELRKLALRCHNLEYHRIGLHHRITTNICKVAD